MKPFAKKSHVVQPKYIKFVIYTSIKLGEKKNRPFGFLLIFTQIRDFQTVF